MLVRTRMTVLAAAVAVGLAGCGSSGGGTGAGGGDGAAGTRKVKADNGTIEIPKNPKRVIATGYAVPALLEGKAPLVGISTWTRGLDIMSPTVKKRYDDTNKIGGDSAKETNYEAIAKAKPDLIVIGVPKPVLGQIDLKRLKRIAPVVAIGPSIPSAWRTLSKRQMDAAGVSDQFEAGKKAYDTKAAALKKKYAGVLGGMKFGHVGGYGDPGKGNFQREYTDSWGTNIQQDIGVTYYGHVKKKTGGSGDVSEYVGLEEMPESLGGADAITYTLNDDGTVPDSVKYVLKSPLWKKLPAVKNKMVFPMRYVQAATYPEALRSLQQADKVLAPLLDKK
jgi:iron complex transport system substrate-binding protein